MSNAVQELAQHQGFDPVQTGGYDDLAKLPIVRELCSGESCRGVRASNTFWCRDVCFVLTAGSWIKLLHKTAQSTTLPACVQWSKQCLCALRAGNHEDALSCGKKALSLQPSNSTVKDAVALLEQLLNPGTKSTFLVSVSSRHGWV